MELYCLILMIVLFAMSFFLTAGKMVGTKKEAAKQKSIISGVESINAASNEIIEYMSLVARSSANKKYNAICSVKYDPKSAILSEADMTGYFRKGYLNQLQIELGKTSDQVCKTLQSVIDESGIKNVTVIDNNQTVVKALKDAAGLITDIYIGAVTLKYSDPIIGERIETLSYDFTIPDVQFFDENEELFRNCLVAAKGIYITGPTSSIIGDIYAGTHSREDMRAREAEFGEISIYGGVNILSTQLGIQADKIISEGDVNVNGSFVIFSSEDKNLMCYAKHLNSFEGFAKKTMYMLDGQYLETDKLTELQREQYQGYLVVLKNSFHKLDKIPMYYDSNNDENYTGRYRKIISNVDVTLSEDFTGIVVTPCNVIVGNDVNVEGLILCGDRIYIRGNNNIVANRNILVRMIEEEAAEDFEYEVQDYIGGIEEKGTIHPQYYVVPSTTPR